MMLRKNCKFIVLAALLLSLSTLFGCAGAAEKQNRRDLNRNLRSNENGIMNRLNTPQNGMTERNLGNPLTGTGNKNMSQRAEKIKTELRKIQGINDVEVLISGDKAIVGCQTSKNLTALKRTIEQRVKSIDPSVREVSVTNSRSILDNMKQMTQDLVNGAGLDGFENKFQQLIKKITP